MRFDTEKGPSRQIYLNQNQNLIFRCTYRVDIATKWCESLIFSITSTSNNNCTNQSTWSTENMNCCSTVHILNDIRVALDKSNRSINLFHLYMVRVWHLRGNSHTKLFTCLSRQYPNSLIAFHIYQLPSQCLKNLILPN